MTPRVLWEKGVTVRLAEQRDLDIVEAGGFANTDDGAAAVFVGGELVAICNEYGTGKLRAGTDATPTQEDVEKLVGFVVEWMEAFL